MKRIILSLVLIVISSFVFPVSDVKGSEENLPHATTVDYVPNREPTGVQIQQLKRTIRELSDRLEELETRYNRLKRRVEEIKRTRSDEDNTTPRARVGTLRWKHRVYPPGDRHGAISVSPTIHPSGDILVSGRENGNPYLFSFDKTGELNWKDKRYRGEVSVGPDGTIYARHSENNNILAVDPNSRDTVWESTSARGSRVSIGPGSGLYTQNSRGELYRFSPEDGTIRWRFTSDIDGERFGDGISIDEDGVAYFTGHSLKGQDQRQMYALRSDGRVKWTYQYDGESRSMPAIGADGTVYAVINFGGGLSNDNGTLVAFSSEGEVKWKFKTGDLITHMNDATFRSHSYPITGPNGHVYVGSSNGYLYKLTPEGELAWEFKADGPVKSTPAVAGDGTVYVGDEKGNVYAIGPGGTEQWRFKSDGRIQGSVNMDKNGNIYFTSWDGNLYSLATSADGLAGSSWPRYRHDSRHSGTSVSSWY